VRIKVLISVYYYLQQLSLH